MSQNATGIVRLAHSASRECAAGESRPQGVLAPDGQRMSIAAAAGIDLKAANKFHASGQFRKCGERGGTPHHIGPGNQVERVSRAVEGQDGIESPERSRVLSPSSSSVSKGAPRTLLARRSRFLTVQAGPRWPATSSPFLQSTSSIRVWVDKDEARTPALHGRVAWRGSPSFLEPEQREQVSYLQQPGDPLILPHFVQRVALGSQHPALPFSTPQSAQSTISASCSSPDRQEEEVKARGRRRQARAMVRGMARSRRGWRLWGAGRNPASPYGVPGRP